MEIESHYHQTPFTKSLTEAPQNTQSRHTECECECVLMHAIQLSSFEVNVPQSAAGGQRGLGQLR